jgi:DNA repair protein RadC
MENLFKIEEVELIYKTKVKPSERIKVFSSKDVVKVFKSIYDINKIELQEMFYVMLLNNANKVLGVAHISTGSTTSCVVDVKSIFSIAIKANASAIVLCHNHPSGNLTPSDVDKQLTKRVKEAGKLLDIAVLDSVIISSEENYFSFADEGII